MIFCGTALSIRLLMFFWSRFNIFKSLSGVQPCSSGVESELFSNFYWCQRFFSAFWLFRFRYETWWFFLCFNPDWMNEVSCWIALFNIFHFKFVISYQYSWTRTPRIRTHAWFWVPVFFECLWSWVMVAGGGRIRRGSTASKKSGEEGCHKIEPWNRIKLKCVFPLLNSFISAYHNAPMQATNYLEFSCCFFAAAAMAHRWCCL